jgi:hypothetical protein
VNRILSRTGVFQLDIDADEVALSRPGEPRVVATDTTEGWSVPSHLQAGAWDLTIDEEEAPRALFITEEDGTVEIEAGRIDAGTIELSGSGFGKGSRVWAYWGEHRSPVAVQVLSETTMNLLLDGSTLPLEEEEVDLLIWTAGEQVPVADIVHMGGDGDTDEPDVPSDSGDPPDESTPPSEEGSRGTDITGVNAELKPGGCSSVPRYPGRFALVILCALICFRREWCEKS